jgi:hypothetical protein
MGYTIGVARRLSGLGSDVVWENSHDYISSIDGTVIMPSILAVLMLPSSYPCARPR